MKHTTDVTNLTQGMKDLMTDVENAIDNGMFTAQRKVAQALLTMVSNNAMVKHFLHKGGLDAVLKLIQECKYFAIQVHT